MHFFVFIMKKGTNSYSTSAHQKPFTILYVCGNVSIVVIYFTDEKTW